MSISYTANIYLTNIVAEIKSNIVVITINMNGFNFPNKPDLGKCSVA